MKEYIKCILHVLKRRIKKKLAIIKISVVVYFELFSGRGLYLHSLIVIHIVRVIIVF